MAYVCAPDRKAERPILHLAGFRGVLQASTVRPTIPGVRILQLSTDPWRGCGSLSLGSFEH